MYWLDTTIVALLALGAAFGLYLGLVRQLARIVSFSAAVSCALAFHDAALPIAQALLREAPLLAVSGVTYLLLFLAVYLLLYGIAVGLDAAVQRVQLQWLNRLLGAVFGAVKIALLLGVTFLSLHQHDHPAIRRTLTQSDFALALANGFEHIYDRLPDEYRAQLHARWHTVCPPRPAEQRQVGR